jgi:hypothetical protein
MEEKFVGTEIPQAGAAIQDTPVCPAAFEPGKNEFVAPKLIRNS